MGVIKYVSDYTCIEDIVNEIKSSSKKEDWIHFKLDDKQEFEKMCGKSDKGIYQFIRSRKFENWEYCVIDFISYVSSSKINGILEIDETDLQTAKKKCNENNYNDDFLRTFEAKVLIHSAPKASWDSIQKDKCLKSWNILNAEGKIKEKNPIGDLLGDPEEFSDYVMLGSGTTCEVVVSSSDKKEINCSIDCHYQPGVRLYFDAQKLAEHGKLIRDGSHTKVKDRLDLKEYLIYSVTAKDIEDKELYWTPKSFTEKADKTFINYEASKTKESNNIEKTEK